MNKPTAVATLTRLSAHSEELDRLRAGYPDGPEIAQDWCRQALQLGQFEQARQCTIDFYAHESGPFERASWARIGGTAAFRLSLSHLCELAEAA